MAKLKGGTRIYGDIKIDGGIYDSLNRVGAAGSVLISTGSSITWVSSVGIATYAATAGIATYAITSGFSTSSGVSTSVIGGIASVTQLSVTGVSTFTNGPIFVGTGTSTGTALQRLQVTGGAYVSDNVGIRTTAPLGPLQVGIGTTTFIVTGIGSVGIGTTNPSRKLHVQGDVRITGGIYDSNNSVGGAASVLTSTGSGIQWAAAAAGGSGTYDTGITTSIYVSVTSGIATGIGTTTSTIIASQIARNNDIFIGPGIAFSFPSTAGREYIIESIHVTNIFSNELYFTGRHDYNGGRNIPMAQRVIVPYQGAAELLEQPIIAGPSDILRFQAFVGVGTTAAGADGGLDAFIVYSSKTDTNYVGVGSTVVSSSGTEIFTSSVAPSVIQSIRLVNYNLNIDIDASVSIYRGGTVGGIVTTGVRRGYLAYNLTVPKNSTIELCEKPKYLARNDSIVAVGSTINSLAVHVSGKYIV